LVFIKVFIKEGVHLLPELVDFKLPNLKPMTTISVGLLPKVTKSGNFYLPDNYQNWQFLSSAMVLQLLAFFQKMREIADWSTSPPTINTL